MEDKKYIYVQRDNGDMFSSDDNLNYREPGYEELIQSCGWLVAGIYDLSKKKYTELYLEGNELSNSRFEVTSAWVSNDGDDETLLTKKELNKYKEYTRKNWNCGNLRQIINKIS